MSYFLTITEEPKSEFYKDEGGKNNCLSCSIGINSYDTGATVTFPSDIPLRITLKYESGDIVEDQSVK